jgi:vacuolar-type H+-ATPase subunit H
MTINVEDYLSRDEIVDEIRYQIRRKVDKDAERILSNTAYDVVFEAVNKALDGKMQETIKNKVLVIINELNDFNVFRSADAWGSPQTVGMKVLNEAIEENRPAIKERVRELVNRYDINSRIEQRIDDSLEDIILTVLKDGLNHNR